MRNILADIPLGLLTDAYQITMDAGYWKTQRQDEEVVFNLFFRKVPFKGGYAVAAGLGSAIEYLKNLRFDDTDISFLKEQVGNDGKPIFEDGFLKWLKDFEFKCDVHAVPEGTVVFANEPLMTIVGPMAQCQLVETALLNIINFQTLIATKASRVCQMAGEDPVLEFGLRRAQGVDLFMGPHRAAYIGGCAGTSNYLAAKTLGIPAKGTHAHSWVMSFDDEQTAFEEYARALPNNCVFLVDTYDTIEGVKKAIRVGRQLRKMGKEMIGIRLDSGDLTKLSIKARKLLDKAGFPEAKIFASNDLDEHAIRDIKTKGGKIAMWGVGTKLVTADGQPALGGVYKLAAVMKEDRSGEYWEPKIKLSEEDIKVSNPGFQQVLRFKNKDGFQGDMIRNRYMGGKETMVLPNGNEVFFDPNNTQVEHLQQRIFKRGGLVYKEPTLKESQQRTKDQLAQLKPEYRRFDQPEQYPVGLEKAMDRMKKELIRKLRAPQIQPNIKHQIKVQRALGGV